MKIYTILLFIHIVAGAIGLIGGTYIMFAKKGTKIHKSAGKIFFYSMVFIFLTCCAMCYLKTNYFLLLVGFFSFYMACTGYRVLAHKKLAAAKYSPFILDKLIFLFGFLSGISIIILGFSILKPNFGFAIVCFFFGKLSIFLSVNDMMKFYRTPIKRNYWITAHSTRMAGAYTATVTAFIVVNIQIEHGWILWILPSFIILPITFRILKNYR